MVYIALFGLLLVLGLIVMVLLSGEGKNYDRQGDSNLPGGRLML